MAVEDPRPGTPAAPQTAAEARREWQARMAAQHTGGMSAQQQEAIRRAAAQRAQQAAAQAAPPRAAAPAAPVAPAVRPQAAPTAAPRPPMGGQSRPVHINRTAAAQTQQIPIRQPGAAQTQPVSVRQPGTAQTQQIPIRQPGTAQTQQIPVRQPGAAQTQQIPIRQPGAAQTQPTPVHQPVTAARPPVPPAAGPTVPAPTARSLPDVYTLFPDAADPVPPAPPADAEPPAVPEPTDEAVLPADLPDAEADAGPEAAPGDETEAQPKKIWPRVLAVVRAVLMVPLTAVKVAALAVIPLFIFWYGYTIDRNGWFQGAQYEREVAMALQDGHSITNYAQMEEREILKIYAQNLEAAPSAIALGSSRILQLTRELTGRDDFFNAGMIGAEYPDIYDSYYLFDRVGLIPDTVVLGIDPWLFSAGPDANTFQRVDMQMWNEYQRFVLGRADVDVTQATENMNFWMALTSPAFFHETMDYYIDNKEHGLRPQVFEGDLENEPGDVKMPDGSVWYAAEMRHMTQEEVNETAQQQFTITLVCCEDFYELDPEHVSLFEQFIDYVQGRGSHIVFFLSPFHPNTYNWVLNFPQRYSGFFQVENWVRQYAAAHGIPVYGSYDPLAAGCTEADFYDAWHVKGDGIRKFFPGLPAVDAARAAGTLPDPLSVTPRMPTAETDPVL